MKEHPKDKEFSEWVMVTGHNYALDLMRHERAPELRPKPWPGMIDECLEWLRENGVTIERDE